MVRYIVSAFLLLLPVFASGQGARLVADLRPGTAVFDLVITQSAPFNDGVLLLEWRRGQDSEPALYVPQTGNPYHVSQYSGTPIGEVNGKFVFSTSAGVRATGGTPYDDEKIGDRSGWSLSSDYPKVTGNGVLYFHVNEMSGIKQLYQTDGTAGSIRPVVSLISTAVEPIAQVHQYLGTLNGRNYYVITKPGGDKEIVQSLGEGLGILPLLSFSPGVQDWAVTSFAATADKLFFQLSGGDSTRGTWVTNGTVENTSRLQTGGANDRYPMYVIGNRAFYVLNFSGDYFLNSHTGELAGLKSVNNFGGTEPRYWPMDGDMFYFDENTTLRRFDVGTLNSEDVFSSNPQPFQLVNSYQASDQMVYFSAGGPNIQELWRSDGTEMGTFKLDAFPELSGTSFVVRSVNGNDVIIQYKRLYKTDGTDDGTMVLNEIDEAPLNSRPNQFTAFNDELIFLASTDTPYSWYRTDGTEVGTIPLFPQITGLPDSSFDIIKVEDNLVYLTDVDFQDYSVWVADLSTDDARMVTNTEQARADQITLFKNGFIYFSYNPDTSQIEIWYTDGTPGSAGLLGSEFNPFADSPMIKSGNHVWFTSNSQKENSVQFHYTDGTQEGTGDILPTFRPDRSQFDSDLHVWNDKLFIRAQLPDNNDEAFFCVVGGESMAARLTPETTGGNYSVSIEVVAAEDAFYFGANDRATDESFLFKTDGTTTGTISLALPAGVDNPRPIGTYGDYIIFRADTESGEKFYRSNLIPGGTLPIDDEWSAIDTSHVFPLRISGQVSPQSLEFEIQRIFMAGAFTRNTGYELYRGWPGELEVVEELIPGPVSSFPSNLTQVGDKVFFVAETPQTGRELFVIDVEDLGQAPVPGSFFVY